jgi:uncharacterized protein YndB with AHSA1/START domain
MRFIGLLAAVAMSTPAAAEVLSSGQHDFEIRQTVNLALPVSQAYAAFARLSAWWSDEHTYSGKAANMGLALKPGGCFCETIPGGGGVEHMRVSVVQPNERIVMTGALGPLLYEAAPGVMDVRFDRTAGGSKVTMNYRAAGFARGNGDKMAPIVDSVLGQQMKRLQAFAAGRK